jgi:pilus assembly protein CpaE
MQSNIGTIIMLIALFGLLFLLLVGTVAFLWWRRSAGKQADKKTAAARKRQAQKRKAQKDDVAEPVAEPVAGTSPPVTEEVAAPTGQPAKAPPPPTPPPAVTGQAPDDGQSGLGIRILIVDDNPDTRDNVSRLLYFENDMEVIGQAVNGRQGIEMAIELKPHIVLMDINMPDMDGITATEKMSFDAPYSQVIMMSVQAEQHYMKRAMAAGARDFQPKPFTADELIHCIHRVYQIGLPIYQELEAAEKVQAQLDARKPQQPKAGPGGAGTPVIAVYSPKGGIGTSAIAINLAIALQQMQGDVVLMDGDLQFGDISVHLNTRPTRTISDMVHDAELDVELLSEVVLAHNSGLKLLLSPPIPQLADTITPAMIPPIIKGLKNQFKAVVVDTTSQLTDVTVNLLENADFVLVVTSPELPAIKSAKLFLELAGQLEFAPNCLGVVINRVNVPGGVRHDQIGKVLKTQQTYLVPYDQRLYMTMYRGLSINQQEPGAPSAQAIAHLARALWQELTGAGAEVEQTVPVREAV